MANARGEGPSRGPGGRPPVGPHVTVRIPAEHLEQLDQLATQNGTSRSHLVREAITQYLTP